MAPNIFESTVLIISGVLIKQVLAHCAQKLKTQKKKEKKDPHAQNKTNQKHTRNRNKTTEINNLLFLIV